MNDEEFNQRLNSMAEHPVRTGLKVFGWVVCVVIALSILFGVIGFIGGWFNEAKRVASPDNVRAQYHTVIEDWHAMQAAAGNYCGAKDSKTNANSPSLVEDPAFAYAAQYRHITVEYNEVQDNIFEAKLVGPKGYPENAPTLAEMEAQVC